MATVNRLKKKKNADAPVMEQYPDTSNPVMPAGERRTKIFSNAPQHTQQKQAQYQAYYQISQCNPLGVQATATLFPHNASLHNQFKCPLGFSFSPMLALQNQNAEVMDKNADRIPRCGTCRAYMNCYNTIEAKKFICFYCGRQNALNQYDSTEQPNNQMNSSIYQAYGPNNFYTTAPPEDTMIFLIDLSPESAQCKMMYYAVAAMKEVLSRPQLDETVIYFYTYDEVLQEYDFSGEQIKCTIIDRSIQQSFSGVQTNLLGQIRDKLFLLLDELEQLSLNNHRRGSNLMHCFSFVYNALKHTGGKFFIFQSNESLLGEPLISEQNPKNKPGSTAGNPVQAPKSILQTRNKVFFDKYVSDMLMNVVSISMFVFTKNYKNLKVFADTFKLTSSELNVYTKDLAPEMDKFYYDLSYLLGCTYFHDMRVQFIASQGWHYTAIYGNFYRVKEHITFKINHIDPSRKFFAIVSPSKSAMNPNPFCAIQVVINYRYKRQDFLTVANIVQPVSGYLDRIYESIDPQVMSAGLSKGFLSSLRMQNLNVARKKVTQAASQIYIAAMEHYKKKQMIPDSIITLEQSILSMLKSAHAQLDTISNSPTMDRVVCERNYLQFMGPTEISTFFNPYLFDLANLEEHMCREDIDFAYPYTIEAKFQNTKQGIFLMDDGLSLYLFVARQCSPQILSQVFGKTKLTKNDVLTEEMIYENQSFRASQIQTLIQNLREQKAYGWIPLYIIRCGQNSNSQRNFYMHFYAQKYDEFRSYKFTLQEFLAMVSRPGSF